MSLRQFLSHPRWYSASNVRLTYTHSLTRSAAWARLFRPPERAQIALGLLLIAVLALVCGWQFWRGLDYAIMLSTSTMRIASAIDMQGNVANVMPPLHVTAQGAAPLLVPTTGCATPSFGQATNFRTENGPNSLAVSDLNGDGKLDLAVANLGSNSVSVLLGNGMGGFGAATNFATGDGPVAIAVGDLNGDGRLDLVVANSRSVTVSVLLGNGLGGFGPATNFQVEGVGGSFPSSIAVGDLNGDGKLDLAVANDNFVSNTVSVLLGNGLGGFGTVTNIDVAGSGPASVAMGDFNGDGKLDLATANYYSDNVSVLLGNGLGGFGAATIFGAGGNPYSVATGDLNKDGKLDLVVANSGSNNVSVLLGDGVGDFGVATNFGEGAGGVSVTVGDLNGDGKLDLATANQFNVSVLLGNGTGGFGAATNFGLGVLPRFVAACDLNGDGKLDLVTTNLDLVNVNDDVSVLLNTCTAISCFGASFVFETYYETGDGQSYVAMGDLNRDGNLDLAVANSGSSNVSVLLGNGKGLFGATTNFATADGPSSVVVGDLNGDGILDLATANHLSNNVSVLLGNGLGGFGPAASFGAGNEPYYLALGDLNGDGKLDLAVANYGSNNVSILLGNGMGGFSTATNFAAGTGPLSMAVGDLNTDGKLDLAVANFGSNNVSILLGDGVGGFGMASSFGVGTGPYSVALGDLNGDGKLDLAVANSRSNNVSLRLGNGLGGFGPGFSHGLVSFPSFVALGDFNGDGKLDLAVTVAGGNHAALALGDGMGGFGAWFDFGGGTGPYSLAVGDLNGDGKLDLAMGNGRFPHISVLLNNCTPSMPMPAMITCPTNITVNAVEGQCAASVPFSIMATGSPTPTITCRVGQTVISSPSIFPIGTTTVICAAINGVGVQLGATCSFTVTVQDTQAPAITCPASIAVGATSTSGAVVTYPAPTNITDNCPGVGTPTCSPASGSNFPIGVTTVTCSVSDAASNPASCSFTITVGRISASISDPLACIGPGNAVSATLTISNNGNVNQNVVDATTFTNLVGLPGNCTANVGTCTVTNAGVVYSGMLTPGQTAVITYSGQVSDLAVAGAQVCANSSVTFNGGSARTVSACGTVTCPAPGPGGILPAKSEASDQKAGSLLIYNIYTSGAIGGNTQNTRINLTNVHPILPSFVHLFFVAEGCSIADSYICLTSNQTASFLASDLDPGTTGYLVALAVNSIGCPTSFNYLIGDEYVKFSSGHAANLGSIAFSQMAGGLHACDGNSVTATLNFDGISYNRLPRMLALDNVGSRADGNDTLLIINRIGGNLATGASMLGTVFGILYNDSESGLSFSVTGSCQLRNSLSNTFPRVTPRFEQFIPAGRTGWLKVFSQADIGLLGAVINYNASAGTSARAFNQGHNLHKLTLATTHNYIIPIFPPG